LVTIVGKITMLTRKSMLTLTRTVTKLTTAKREPLVTLVTNATMVTMVTKCNGKANLKLSLYTPGRHTGGAQV
jgi:hypothetical protein